MKIQYVGHAAILYLAIVASTGCNALNGGFLGSGLQPTFDRSVVLDSQSQMLPLSSEPLVSGDTSGSTGVALSPTNTQIEFTGAAGPMKQKGHFNQLSGSFAIPKANQSGSIDVTISMESLETKNWLLTKHLKSRDFFDVKQHPTSRFVSTSIQPTQHPERYLVVGQLTIHGVTQNIESPAIINVNPDGLQLSMEFTVRQTDFGMERGARKTRNEVPVSITAKIPVLR